MFSMSRQGSVRIILQCVSVLEDIFLERRVSRNRHSDVQILDSLVSTEFE